MSTLILSRVTHVMVFIANEPYLRINYFTYCPPIAHLAGTCHLLIVVVFCVLGQSLGQSLSLLWNSISCIFNYLITTVEYSVHMDLTLIHPPIHPQFTFLQCTNNSQGAWVLRAPCTTTANPQLYLVGMSHWIGGCWWWTCMYPPELIDLID